MITVRATWQEWDPKENEECAWVVITTYGASAEGWYYIPHNGLFAIPSEGEPYWSWLKSPNPPFWVTPVLDDIERMLRPNVEEAGKVLEFIV